MNDRIAPARRLGHHSVVPPRIGPGGEPLDAATTERLRTAYVPSISDKVGRLYTLDSGLRPLYAPMRRIVGVALTVKAPAGDNFAIHGALSMAQEGDVLVVDWQGYREGCGTGAGSLVPAVTRGLAGVVIDGGFRDVEEVRALDVPVLCRGVSAFSPGKSEVGEINVPVSVGGVIVTPGDIVVADAEGAVVIPRWCAGRVLDALPDYEQRHAIDDWPLERMQQNFARRREHFERIFAEADGVHLDGRDY